MAGRQGTRTTAETNNLSNEEGAVAWADERFFKVEGRIDRHWRGTSFGMANMGDIEMMSSCRGDGLRGGLREGFVWSSLRLLSWRIRGISIQCIIVINNKVADKP